MDSTSSRDSRLEASLESRLQSWQKARDPQEQKMRDCYADEMRIPRDDDTKGTGHAKARKTKGIFVGVTRSKIRSVRAKLIDSLFPNGAMPFDTEPTNEEMAPYADAVEEILNEQLARGGYKKMLKAGVHLLARYGTAFTFGPFVRQETLTSTAVDTSMGFPRIVEQSYSFDLPYFELADSLDVFPDPDVDDPTKGAGVYWVSMESPHTVRSWAAFPGYMNIEEALKCLETNADEHGSDQARQLRGNVDYWRKDGRVKVARYFGKVSASLLQDDATMAAVMSGELEMPSDEQVEALVILAGGVVIRKTEVQQKRRQAQKCVYEDAPNEMWGVGIAENNMSHQAIVNSGFRLFNEGKGMALLGTRAVDRSKFLPREDFKKYPGKVYEFKPGLTPEEQKAAIQTFIEEDVSSGWQEVIALSERFSDDDTGVTKYTQGTDANHLNKTATGISMIMGASALPLKDVLANIDEMWVEQHIEALIDWNLKYLEPETVEMLLGKECAEKWAAVKNFGKTSFMTWRAIGSSTFMQKEVLINKLQSFMALVGGNQVLAQSVDMVELLRQVWDALQTGKESPIKDEDSGASPEVQQQLQGAMQQMQAMAAQIEALQKALEEAQSSTDIDAYKAVTDRLKALESSLSPEVLAAAVLQVMQASAANPMPTPEPPGLSEEFTQGPADAGLFVPDA